VQLEVRRRHWLPWPKPGTMGKRKEARRVAELLTSGNVVAVYTARDPVMERTLRLDHAQMETRDEWGAHCHVA
jgi:hypothetical protein